MKRAIRAGLLAAAGAAALSGCVVQEVQVGEEGPECQVDGDCARRGGADEACVGGACESKSADPKWGCLDGPPLAPTGALVDLRLEVISAIARAPAVGALVRACHRLDPACSAPLVPDTPVDARGRVILGVGDGFDGYFEVRSPAAEPTRYVPQILYLPRREIMLAANDEGAPRRALLFTEAELQGVLQPVGGTFDVGQPPNAFVLATTLDCAAEPARGVTFSLLSVVSSSKRTVRFYTDENDLPRLDATETSASGTFALTNLIATDSAGPGPVALSATIDGLKRTVGVGAPSCATTGSPSSMSPRPERARPRRGERGCPKGARPAANCGGRGGRRGRWVGGVAAPTDFLPAFISPRGGRHLDRQTIGTQREARP